MDLHSSDNLFCGFYDSTALLLHKHVNGTTADVIPKPADNTQYCVKIVS